MNQLDVVVVGGGAAGLSAALVLTRTRRSVAVIDAGEPRNAPAAHMHGFLGSDGLPPGDLLAAGRKEVIGYGGQVIAADVGAVARTSTSNEHPRFEVTLTDGQTLRARRLLIATGLGDRIPDIPGLRERWGRDLLHCPYCHGWEVRDTALGVLGGTPEAVTHAHLIRQWSDDVLLFTDGTPLSPDHRAGLASRDIGIVDSPVARLVVADNVLLGVELTPGELVHRAAVFVRPEFVPHDDLLETLGCATSDDGWVTVDGAGGTSVAGVWAAGNVTNPRAQVITAAGEGSAAAIAINADLVAEDISLAASPLPSGPS